jgi:hypothetical protein
MVEKIAVKIPRSWRDDFLSLRDTLPEDLGQELIAALANRSPEQLQAMVEQLQAKGTPTTEGNLAAGANSNAELPQPEPAPPDTVAIILRNGALLADHIGGKRYLIDKPIRVTPQEFAGIEAELAQRPKVWGLSYTRLERVLIHPAL